MNVTKTGFISAHFVFFTLFGAIFLEHYGLNASSDSLKYLDAAVSWNHLLELNGVWPPGYPALIWMISSLGVSRLFAASIVSSLSIAGGLYALFDLGRENHNWVFGLLAASCLFLYTDLHGIALTVLTEGLFCGLLMMFCAQLWHWLHHGQKRHLYIITILVGLTCLTRYAGYVLIPVLFFAVWIKRENVPWKHWIGAFTLSFSPLIGWLLYNVNRYGHLHGARKPSVVGVAENLGRLWDTLSVNLLAAGLLLPFSIASILVFFRKNDTERWSKYWAGLVWMLVGAQLFLTVYSSSTVLLDPINTRLTAGIYATLLPLSVLGLVTIAHKVPVFTPYVTIGILLASMVGAQWASDPNRESKARLHDFEQKYSKHSFINLFGFNQSDTAGELRAFFEEHLESNTEPTHVLWFEQSKSNQKFQLLHHRNFLFKKNLQLISTTSDAEQLRMAVQVNTKSNGHRALIVHNITKVKGVAVLQKRITDIMAKTKQSQVILIGRKPMFKKWKALDMTWSVTDIETTCSLSKNALHYAILSCTSELQSTPQERASTSVKSTPTQTKKVASSIPGDSRPYISEIMQVPLKVAKFRGEWIELYNPTDTAIDLSTYSIHSKDDTGITFTSEHNIEPKSAFLLAVRKSPSGNGGLPPVDYVYKHEVLKVMATDWIELRNGDDVVDRWEFTREELKKGYSIQRNADGKTCHATETYGEGDYGSPKKLTVCK